MIVTQALHRLPRWLPRVFLANALMASALFGPVDWATTSSLAEEGGGSRLDTNTPETNYVSVQSAQDAALFGTISGVVFRDYNGNGLQGTNDLGIAGVIITATDNSIPAQTVSTVTLNDGSYTLPQLAGTQARVIFSLPPSLSFLRPGMPTVGSSVRFVDISAGNATGINMSYNNPDEYCQANPLIILNTFRNGTSVGNANAGCVSFAYDVADGSPNDTGGDVPIQYGIPALPGTAANPRIDAQLQQIGSTWGIAHQHIPLRVFLSSFVRRHVGLGPRGEDGVYVIDYSNSAAASVVGGFDVQGVAPRNGGALIDVGTVTRTGSNDYVLGVASMSNVDLDAFDKMGKVSFGDTDIGEDGKTLWMVNLNQRGLIQVDLSNYTPSMANPSFLPTNVISQYLLSPALGEPTCVGGVFRPWALKFKDQRGYLGGMCSGEVSQQITDVVAYVLSFDPQNAGLGFSTVLSVSMNYTRENNMNGLGFLPERWHAWASTWAQTGLTFPITSTNGPDSGAYGQPILSDIEFTENGSIVLGFSDRFGHQTGYDQYIPMPSADTLYGGFTSVSSGDILQVCRTASGYVMEGGVGCATGEVAGGSRRVDDGPGGSGEFYYQDTYITNGANGNTAPTHDETTLGGLLWLPGSGQVATTVFDPVDYPVSTSPSNRGLNTVGVHWYNNRTGSKDDGYLVSSTGSKDGMGKATSLGDMDLLCDPAPISVGNRVWVDSNQDGIQDPAELGLAGVTVQLVDNSGAVISTTTTSNTGDYSFNGLSFNSAYTIQIPIAQSALAAYTMTLPNATGIVSNDWITDILDSDGQLLGGAIAIPFMTGDAGENNYSFDFGVRLLIPNIAMSKHTNGNYAPTGTGPQLLVGSTVTWTYVVTNTGEVTLTNFTLTDDRQGAINTNNCAPNPSPNFAPNAVTTCQITGTVTQGQYTNTANIVAANIFSASQQVSSTSVSHYLGLLPQLAILKLTNGSDADNAPGLIVAAGSTVTWTYLVTNTGNVTLSNVAVNDDQIGAVNCPANTLNPNASMTCLATGIAISGQYTNVGTASGTTPTGLSFTSTVTATNPSHYFGVNPSMALTKLTNGVYTTSDTGPVLSIGAAVTWTYVVTNTGNVSLTNIALSDDREGAITCPQSSLNVGASMTCVRVGTVITGQYVNNATISASNPLSNSGNITPTVTVTSASRYLGVSVGLQMTKLTHGAGDAPQDADSAPGPLVGMGRTVTWTYILTNTGSVTLTNVSLVDDQLGAVSCPSTTLNPQTTMTCVVAGVAIAGQYVNVATVTGAPPSSLGLPATITATNPSHYFGVNPSMALTKLTNGVYTTSGTGPVLSIGAAVTWTYVVTNTGNVSLTNIALSDDREGAITCPQNSLNVGASMTCVRTGTVITGQYLNNATLSASNPLSNSGNITPTVTATSASRYLGVSVGLEMTKLTHGAGDAPQDADSAPGPLVGMGQAVTWTYIVTNTGSVTLTSVSLVDDQLGVVSCPSTTLNPQTTMTCVATGVAIAGQYTNVATTTGAPPSGLGLPTTITATNPSHYFGVNPSMALTKLTNGVYTTSGTGPVLSIGAAVTWTYVVTNTGNVSLTNIALSDDREGAITCPQSSLNVGASMTCVRTGTVITGQYLNNATLSASNPLSNSGNITPTVTATSASRYLGVSVGLEMTKLTHGAGDAPQDADSAPGPLVGMGSTVTWTYIVTNTGSVTLTSVSLVDDQLGAVSCPSTTLNPQTTMTCVATGVAIAGQYTNVATATGAPPSGLGLPTTITATNPSHYFGVNPSMALTKLTNGVYTTSGTGPVLSIGAAVTWTYVVTNTGNVSLTNIALSDDREGAITCPQSSLNVGASMTCVRTGTVITGQYLNNATLSASNPLSNSGNITPTVTATSASRYLGVSVGLQMTKLTHGAGDAPQDADNAPGPLVGMGQAVTWTYLVTNTGSVTLTSVSLVDDQLGAVSCPSTTLNPQTAMTCVATGVAIAGQYTNVATATGAPPSGLGLPSTITATNPSHYFGVNPSMTLTKLTNGVYTTTGTGPVLSIGAAVTWTYVVTNTGNVSLTNIALSDDREGAITCPQSSLNVGASMTCVRTGTVITGQYLNNATLSASNPLSNSGNITPTVTVTSASRYLGINAAIQVIKFTNGAGDVPQDADGMPGPLIGAGRAVTWTYWVTNTGTITLSNIVLSDDQVGTVNCPANSLAPSASMVCVATGVAIAGQYTNTATVSGATPAGLGAVFIATASNPSHYFGVDPRFVVTKLTNGVSAQSGSGPLIGAGALVTWTYIVTNTGNVTLTNIALNDDRVGVITCPSAVLAVASVMTCSATGVAVTGQYVNNVFVTATHPFTNAGNITPTVTMTDSSRYFGVNPSVTIVKLTNGPASSPADADVVPGPTITAGLPVTWTYRITNTGNVTLTNLSVGDNREGVITPTLCTPSLVGLQLAPGAGVVCNLVGVARAGQYSNTGMVTATNVMSNNGQITPTVTANNLSHYLGVQPPADNSAIAGLGDYVWIDVNHNGVQDADEVGLGDVIVRLRNADTNAELAVTRTNASGYYSFTNLNAGRYVVQFVLPDGYSFTLQGASNTATNSDADTVTGLTTVYTLTTGQYIPTIDAGVWQPMTIGNYVWHDANNDSAVNANELGFRNVLLELYEDTNKDGMFELGTDRMLLSTQTDNNGRYQFTNLVPGSYFVILPAANFVAGANLASLYPSTAAVSSSSNQDSRNHGVAVGVLGNDGYVVATVITLVNNQLPTTDGDTNTNTNMSIDFGLNDQNPTAVSLMAFHSQRQASGRIDVSWVTGQEVDTYGFVLYRSEGMATSTTMPANAVKVTDQIILGKGRGQGGASYEWADYSAQLGKTYTYWLVEIETSGNENHYGPAAPSFKGGSRVLLPLLMTSKR